MLSDHNAINDINPFVMIDFSLPGSSATPFEFSEYTRRKEGPADFEQEKEVIACEVNPTGAFCQDRTPNCPMSRYILPERVFQYEDGSVNTELNGRSRRRMNNNNNNNNNVILLIILIALFVLIR